MKIRYAVIEKAVYEGILSREEADALMDFNESIEKNEGRFTVINVLYYLGGLMVVIAITSLLPLAYDSFAEYGILSVLTLYFCAFLWLSVIFLKKDNQFLTGVFGFFCILITPFIVYLALSLIGNKISDSTMSPFLPNINRLMIESITLVVASLILVKLKEPFIVLPTSISVWVLSNDISYIFSNISGDNWLNVSALYTGLLLIFIALFVEKTATLSRDYTYWLYWVGGISVMFGLIIIFTDKGEVFKNIIFGFLCFFMAVIGAIIKRKAFTVIASIGLIYILISRLLFYFEGSLFIPFMLSIFGLSVILAGVIWSKKISRIILFNRKNFRIKQK